MAHAQFFVHQWAAWFRVPPHYVLLITFSNGFSRQPEVMANSTDKSVIKLQAYVLIKLFSQLNIMVRQMWNLP